MAPWRSRLVDQQGRKLSRKLARWAEDNRDAVAAEYDRLDVFALDNDRAAEMFAPLQAVLTVADPVRLGELEQTARRLVPADVDADAKEMLVRLVGKTPMPKGGLCKEVETRTGLSNRTIRRHLNDLVAVGVLWYKPQGTLIMVGRVK